MGVKRLILFVVAAIGALEIPTVTDFMNEVLAYLPNILVAILIFVVAALLSSAVSGGVKRAMGETTTGSIVASTAPALIMVIAMFMILEQLQIAPEIVQIAFAAVMGALALGLALAFGLGGRGVAERLLEDAYRNSQRAKQQARQDLDQGRARAETQVGNASSSESVGTGSTTSFQTRTLGDTTH